MPAQNGRLKLRIIRGSNKGEQSVCAILQAFRAAALVGPKHFFSKFPAFQFPCTFTYWVFAANLWEGWRRWRAPLPTMAPELTPTRWRGGISCISGRTRLAFGRSNPLRRL